MAEKFNPFVTKSALFISQTFSQMSFSRSEG